MGEPDYSDPRREWIAQFNPEALMADGYDEAVVGVAERCGQPSLVVYDANKCIQILIDRDGMDYDEAYEFFQFNTLGAWAGENSPLYLWRREEDENGL
jgi:hypothetical protein